MFVRQSPQTRQHTVGDSLDQIFSEQFKILGINPHRENGENQATFETLMIVRRELAKTLATDKALNPGAQQAFKRIITHILRNPEKAVKLMPHTDFGSLAKVS